MTLLAGMYSLNLDKAIDPKTVDLLRESIARTQGEIDTYADRRFALVKWDCGAFREPGFLEDEHSVTALAGEPYSNDAGLDHYSRSEDLVKISEKLASGQIDHLRSCHGTFSICYYDKERHRLVLATDKLGVRPIYYYSDGHLFYFASTIRILEAVDTIPKRFNLEGFVEKRIFGVALGTKTRYCDVKGLRDGQYLTCAYKGYDIGHYFRWDEIGQYPKDMNSLLTDCYEVFRAAVAVRGSRDSSVFAFLSGGLDSRSVVSTLNDLGKTVTAFNFSVPGEKDEAYAKDYADQIGAKLISRARPVVDWSVSQLVSETIRGLEPKISRNVNYPQLIFAGDGGSVGMGHVYMSHALLEARRTEGLDGALSYFLRNRNFPDRIFRQRVKRQIRPVRFNSLKKELEEVANAQPGRDIFLFLLRNDQRRHLQEHWENIDLTKVEFLLPFYDARLLGLVASAPIDPFIGHHFYHEWIKLFPDDIRSVPWQSYPGHEPCPIEKDDEYVTQWDNSSESQKLAGKIQFKRCLSLLYRNNFPSKLTNRAVIVAALMLYLAGFKRYGYIFDLVNALYDDYRGCENSMLPNC